MNKSLNLQVQGCEDLWIDVEFPDIKAKNTLAVVYRHPCNNVKNFIDSLDDKMQILNRNKGKVVILGDFNF